MSNIQQLIGLLARPDVSEIILQSGSPPFARTGTELKPLSKQSLSVPHIEKFVQGTPVAAMLQNVGSTGRASEVFTMKGVLYEADITSSRDLTRVILTRSGSPSATTKAPRRDVATAISKRKVAVPAARRETRQQTPKPTSAKAIRKVSIRPASVSAPQPKRAFTPPAIKKPVSSILPGSIPTTRGQTAPDTIKQSPANAPDALVRLLSDARARNASDVHIMSGQPARIRMVGDLEPHGPELSHDQVRHMLTFLLTNTHRVKFDEFGYADLSAEIAGGRVRVNINRQRGGWKGCFRLVADKPASLEQLGLPPELIKLQVHHQGLAVISGPNGSGKTTTLAALVDLFNATRPVHIVTVEDPVEVLHSVKKAVITQREVGTHTKSFYRALKGALREDPDIIVIGELRDRETVEMALSAAETGHLVLATMSTPSGARTIDRLIDMFPPDVQSQVRSTLAGALKMVISQRLVPTIDRSRNVVAAEVITGNMSLWTLIRDNKLFQLPSLLQRGLALGMIRIEDSLNALVKQGVISVDVARSYADNPKSIEEPGTSSSVSRSAHTPPHNRGSARRGGISGLFKKKDS